MSKLPGCVPCRFYNPDLDAGCHSFADLLGWYRAGDNPDCPVVFVSDGTVMLTRWQAKRRSSVSLFDKSNNAGFHPLVIKVAGVAALGAI
jgi:hypothetical protein